MMRMRFFLTIGLLVVLSSCSKAPDKWDRDYYDYQFGAIINGIEHHIIYGRNLGFSMTKFDRVAFIDWMGYKSTIKNNPRGNGGVSLIFEFVTDTISINTFKRFLFVGDDDVFSYCINPDSFSSNQPLVSGCFIKHYEFYVINEGWIEFGEFEDGNNKDIIRFECTAVNEKGDTLKVLNGYCKPYCKQISRPLF